MTAISIATANNKSKKDFYEKLKRVITISDLQLQITKIVNRLGLSDYTFVPLERDWEYEQQQGLLSTLPLEYWRLFRERELHTHDMIVSFFRDNTHPCHTSHIYNYYCDAPFDTEITRINRAIRQLQHSFGFFEQYAIPVVSADGSQRFLFMLAQQNVEAADFQNKTNGLVSQLRALGHAIQAVCEARFPNLFQRPAPTVVDIAPKPLRVLATLANNDLSITDVASKLCISPITAHQHIAAARKALNKQTNIGAIKEAVKQGLISYDYD